MKKGKTVLIASGKGGTGKSIIACNMAAAAALSGKSVVLVDMSFGARDLDLYMGMQDRVVYDLADVLNDGCALSQAMVKDKRFKSLYLLPAPPEDNPQPSGEKLAVLLETLTETMDVVIIDGGRLPSSTLEFLAPKLYAAVVVVEPGFASLRQGDAMDMTLKKSGLTRVHYLINKAMPDLMADGVCPDFEEIELRLKSKVAGIIQYDDNFIISSNLGHPIVLKEESYISDNLKKITRRVLSK